MSNILKNVFKVTKELEKSSERALIKEKLSDLQKTDFQNGELFYQGSHLNKQFLGFLVLYFDRTRINKESPTRIEELPDETIRLLSYGHNYLDTINKMCLNPLLDLLPNAYKVINPYWYLQRNKDFSSEIKISISELDNFVQSFQLSKPFQVIKNRLQYLPDFRKLKEQDIVNSVYSTMGKIGKSGLKNCPRDIFELGLIINKKSPEAFLGSIIFSLICIHSALQIIDQILYQSFISDKMIYLNEDNIFNILHRSSNGLSETIELTTSEIISTTNEVIIVQLPMKDAKEKEKDFCLVEEIKVNFSQDFGNETTVGLRCIDNSTTIYPNLIKNINLL